MFARIPLSSLSRWVRPSLLLALSGLPLYVSCTNSEDTEPFVPASQGAKQPGGSGSLVSEADACSGLLKAAKAAYDRLNCDPAPSYPECPGFLRPGGGSGCFEYDAGSINACKKAYDGASSCREVTPCVVTAIRNDSVESCELVGAAGGGGGSGPGAAGAPAGGAPLLPEAGGPAIAGAGGQTSGGAGG